MRRIILLGALIIISCQAITPVETAVTTSAPISTSVSPTEVPPTSTSIPEATATPEPEVGFEVLIHPDGHLYIGDQISMEVIALSEMDMSEKKVQIQAGGIADDGAVSEFASHGIGARLQATFNWVWDTSSLEPGEYDLIFSILPEGPTWKERVLLNAREDEAAAHWETVLSECCEIHYISGTEFERELTNNLEIIQSQAEEAARGMELDFDQRIEITILPRVLGHGGFASSEIYVSHLEENYAGNDLAQVLHHEMVHILDRRLGGELRPSLFVEGLAVYLSDGHFKKEPLLSKAAVLLDLGWYLPLDELADSFYTSQHEIGYLEGGALVTFMVDRYGWDAFNNFYRDIHPHPSERQSKAIGKALQAHFGITLQQMESLFKSHLQSIRINPDMQADLILTIEYYDAVRRYQQLLDRSAYFLTAWLPAGEEMRERGIVADYMRRPEYPQNLEIVDLLVGVDRQIRMGNYLEAERALRQVNRTLDRVEREEMSGN